MQWTQVIDPFNDIALSALVALVPIAVIFWALLTENPGRVNQNNCNDKWQ